MLHWSFSPYSYIKMLASNNGGTRNLQSGSTFWEHYGHSHLSYPGYRSPDKISETISKSNNSQESNIATADYTVNSQQHADETEADSDMQAHTLISENSDDSGARGGYHDGENSGSDELLQRWKELTIKKKPKYGILWRRSSEARADQGIYDESDGHFFDIASSSLKSSEKQKLIKLPSDTKVEDKLANAERKLAHVMRTKREKRERFKAIIEADEIQLQMLEENVKDLEREIEIWDDKITAMKREKKRRPLHKKVSAQFQIAKSVFKRDRLKDDRVVLKNQCASMRKRIQKYKTKIRYDLQILHTYDTAVPAANPSGEKVHLKSKPERRPIPACFFVGTSQPAAREEVEVTPSIKVEDLMNADSNQLCIGRTGDPQVTSEENLIAAHSSGSTSEESVDKGKLGHKWRIGPHGTKDVTAKSANREFECTSNYRDGTFNTDCYTQRHGFWLARNGGSSSDV